MLRITFILPGSGHTPSGGFKVVYEYANNLAGRGHDVTILHPANIEQKPNLTSTIKWIIKYFFRKIANNFQPKHWVKTNPNVKMLWTTSPANSNAPDSDFVIATFWKTAEWVAQYPASKGIKLYLIQHLETCMGPEDQVMATWKLPLHKIVIAKWLQSIAKSLGETSTYIPNGLDFNQFYITKSISERVPTSVIMLYHKAEWKGSEYGISAIEIVRKKYPYLKVSLFGTPPHPSVPDYIDYYQNPKQSILRDLYNQSAIFIAPSLTEGWGLPASEAMMCGCAVVGTDIGGHKEFMEDQVTALISPPCDIEAMAKNIIELINNSNMRISIAASGNTSIHKFTWEHSTNELAKLFSSLAS